LYILFLYGYAVSDRKSEMVGQMEQSKDKASHTVQQHSLPESQASPQIPQF